MYGIEVRGIMLNNELLTLETNSLKDDVYIWGTGNTSLQYIEGLNRLDDEGFVINGYCDNNKEKWGNTFNNKKIFSPGELIKKKDVLVLIATPQPKAYKSISEQLSQMNIHYMHIDEYIFNKHKKELLECYDILEDDESKKIYAHLISCRINACYPISEYIASNQYFGFYEFSNKGMSEVFVDCGAYTGDSVERFIWNRSGIFDKIYAFEPDKNNISAMEYRFNRLKKEWNIVDEKLVIYPYGISDKCYISMFESNSDNGLGSRIISDESVINGSKVKCVCIDDFITDKIDLIKADIEGYEYRLILGAKDTIAKYKPKLAICIYHNAVDFYEIPLLIKKINPSYKLAVRHYSNVISETVLYAY